MDLRPVDVVDVHFWERGRNVVANATVRRGGVVHTADLGECFGERDVVGEFGLRVWGESAPCSVGAATRDGRGKQRGRAADRRVPLVGAAEREMQGDGPQCGHCVK